MKISHGTRITNINDTNGYGYATKGMLDSLARLGYEVNPNDKTADVEIWFDQPHHWDFSPNTYKIGYHPWESTKLLPPDRRRTNGKDWLEAMNACDEIWTPSPLIAEWYGDFAGITVPVFVYEHGVEPRWTPRERKVTDRFKFLHVGGEATRKGVVDAMKALRLAFPGHTDVELNLKIMTQGWKVGQINRVNVINERWPLESLIQLFHDNHVYVYPSYGEGFGLTPLQAMATGMPTITVPAWAPYAKFLDPNLSVGSKPVKSPWPLLHPGNMLQPSMDDLVESMRFAYSNYDLVQKQAHAAVAELTAYYDWDRLTKQAFGALEDRLKNS